jgi:FixJ family two-component response regulator
MHSSGSKSPNGSSDPPASESVARSGVVHIIDDDASFRQTVARMMKTAGYQVVEYESAEHVFENLAQMERGCILLDVQMPGMMGPQLQELLVRSGCHLPVVFISGYNDLPTTVRTIKAGAEDFLLKPISRGILLEAVERALNKFDEDAAKNARRHDLQALIAKLTPREDQVFRLVIRGTMNKQIAYSLGTSERTIKAHRHNIMSKLDADTVADLVSMADRLGIPTGFDEDSSDVRPGRQT